MLPFYKQKSRRHPPSSSLFLYSEDILRSFLYLEAHAESSFSRLPSFQVRIIKSGHKMILTSLVFLHKFSQLNNSSAGLNLGLLPFLIKPRLTDLHSDWHLINTVIAAKVDGFHFICSHITKRNIVAFDTLVSLPSVDVYKQTLSVEIALTQDSTFPTLTPLLHHAQMPIRAPCRYARKS